MKEKAVREKQKLVMECLEKLLKDILKTPDLR
jgi:hypothetical protein